MSESTGEKTEEPTEHRLTEVRKKGQLPQRKNVLEAVLMVLAIIMFTSAVPEIGQRFVTLMDASLDALALDFQEGLQLSFTSLWSIVVLVMAIVVGLTILTLFFGLLLNKFNFATESLSPKFEKLNPVNGLKQIFSLHTLYNFGRLLFFFIPIAMTTYLLIWGHIQDMVNASACGWRCVAAVFLHLVMILVIVFALLQVILGALDLRLQNALFLRDNKMTKDDVKREHKQNEGDPLIKGERRNIAMKDAVLPPMSEATHVVVGGNILVALIYYPDTGQDAYMLFKHRGTRVAEFVSRFQGHKCPIVKMPNQARRLFSSAEVGRFLPSRTSNDVKAVADAAQG